MKLYRIILGDRYTHLNNRQIEDILFFPEIPHNRLVEEDSTTERICLAESIEGCFTAIGAHRLEEMLYETDNELSAIILTFDTEQMDLKYLRSPEDIDLKVPDAYLTREWWYELPIKPVKAEVKVLKGFDSKDSIYVLPKHLRNKELNQEEKFTYIKQAMPLIKVENIRWCV